MKPAPRIATRNRLMCSLPRAAGGGAYAAPSPPSPLQQRVDARRGVLRGLLGGLHAEQDLLDGVADDVGDVAVGRAAQLGRAVLGGLDEGRPTLGLEALVLLRAVPRRERDHAYGHVLGPQHE